jgi:coproporphyrinogen III oxidase
MGRDASLADRARALFTRLQDEICAEVERLDGGRFREDVWDYRPAGGTGLGGGRTRILADSVLIEKGGVNLSALEGQLSPRIAERLRVAAQPFFATGVSLVLHPRSPMVPTVHLNLRYIELRGAGESERPRAWFGGGSDLTPFYLYEEDAREFHRALSRACEAYEVGAYSRFKQACDEYFYLPHRGEARGIGGIFFDYLARDPDRALELAQGVGRAFLEAWPAIAERRRGETWGEAEREWQLIRRGRYVEFNLIHDRGTLFGLETEGRTESILMSLPPVVRWAYDHRPAEGSREAALLEVLRHPREWVDSARGV